MAENDQKDVSSLMDSIADEVKTEEASKSFGNDSSSDNEEKEAQKRMLELREKSLEVSEAASTVAVDSGKSDGKIAKGQGVDEIVSASGTGVRGEVSASTIGRMMGLVTSAEFKLLENKLDLLSTRMNSMLVKMEKVLVMAADMPNGSDLERIDVQLADARTVLNEIKAEIINQKEDSKDKKTGGSILSN